VKTVHEIIVRRGIDQICKSLEYSLPVDAEADGGGMCRAVPAPCGVFQEEFMGS
jgi:hypothetical protein